MCEINIDYNKRNEIIDKRIKSVINCHDCFLCCQNSSAFVLSHEVKLLRSLKVPLHKENGIYFITPLPDGRCPNLNTENKCCIYNDRPISCRIFPFYLFNRPDLVKKWAFFDFCPENNYTLKKVSGKPNMTILEFIVYELEKNFSNNEIIEMIDSDAAIAKFDLLEVGDDQYFPIMETCQI